MESDSCGRRMEIDYLKMIYKIRRFTHSTISVQVRICQNKRNTRLMGRIDKIQVKIIGNGGHERNKIQ